MNECPFMCPFAKTPTLRYSSLLNKILEGRFAVMDKDYAAVISLYIKKDEVLPRLIDEPWFRMRCGCNELSHLYGMAVKGIEEAEAFIGGNVSIVMRNEKTGYIRVVE